MRALVSANRSWLKRGGAILGALFAGGTAVVVVLVGINRPAGFWDSRNHRYFLFAALGLVFVGASRDALSRYRRDRDAKLERVVEEVLTTGLIKIHSITKVPITELGVHAFVVRRDRWRPWTRVLVRMARVRLGNRRRSGAIRWTVGKGAIGVCWENRTFFAVDVGAFRKFAQPKKRAAWERVPADKKYGLSHEDLMATSAYGTIAAHPIFRHDGTFVGCVSVDGPTGVLDKFSSQDVQDALAETASAVWLVGRPVDSL